MKIKNIVTVLLVALILVSCTPAAKVVPTETAIPTSTFTPIPLMPTITLTASPENIVNSKDLSIWIDGYIHAFSGKVTVNGKELDASQLTDEIKKNSGAFTQVKVINGIEYSFLVINDTPLAFRQKDKWQRVYLKSLADMQGIMIGSNIQGWIWNDPTTTENYFFNVNFSTTGSDWLEFEPAQGKYDFTALDGNIDFAKTQGVNAFRCHVPVSADVPEWLVNGNYSKDEVKQILTKSITEMVTHGKEKGVTEWIVVNEPYGHKLKNAFLERTLGDEYYEIAFQAARNADPNAKLILMDNDNYHPQGTWETSYQIAKALKEKNLIDAVGFQMHLVDMEWVTGGIPTKENILSTLAKFKKLGLELYFTEFDYEMRNYAGTPEQKIKRQAEIYAMIFQVGLDAGVNEFTFWHMTDKYARSVIDGEKADSTMMDSNMRPKPAYYSIIQILYRRLP